MEISSIMGVLGFFVFSVKWQDIFGPKSNFLGNEIKFCISISTYIYHDLRVKGIRSFDNKHLSVCPNGVAILGVTSTLNSSISKVIQYLHPLCFGMSLWIASGSFHFFFLHTMFLWAQHRHCRTRWCHKRTTPPPSVVATPPVVFFCPILLISPSLLFPSFGHVECPKKPDFGKKTEDRRLNALLPETFVCLSQ